MKALIMKPGADSLETIELPDDDTSCHSAIRELVRNGQPVDGWLESCFHLRGEDGHIRGWCDEEGRINGRTDFSVLLGNTLRLGAPYPISGPVVITGATSIGDYRSLTPNELSHFTLSKPIRAGGLRVLEWEG
jgi:hypothetical protein